MSYDNVECDKCGGLCEAHYLLSPRVRALWVLCNRCGKHARPYEVGHFIKVQASKPLIQEYGKQKSEELAQSYESKKGDFVPPQIVNKPKETMGLASFPSNYEKLYCDAGTKNNGRPNQRCVIVVTNDNGDILIEKWIGNKTNNEGELAAIRAACNLIKKGEKNTVISSDSDLSVKLVNLEWFAKKEHLKPQVYDTIAIVRKKNVNLLWEPRNKNKAGVYLEEKYSL